MSNTSPLRSSRKSKRGHTTTGGYCSAVWIFFSSKKGSIKAVYPVISGQMNFSEVVPEPQHTEIIS